MNQHNGDDFKDKDFKEITSEENKIFSVMPRFAIMLILHNYNSAKIKDLAKTLNLTPGNIDHHLRILEENNVIKKRMQIFQQRVYAIVEVTEKGKKLFNEYLESLKNLLQ